jgi:anaerobic selenocysteine-containing dehydrogenase
METRDIETIKTVCGMCGMGCGVNVTLYAGKIKKVTGIKDHPLNRGTICQWVTNVSKFLYHPDRLRYPVKKEKDGWKRITWEEALEIIADRLQVIKGKYGARSLADEICQGLFRRKIYDR